MIISSSKKSIMLCGPALSAVSGVSTHLNQLLDSPLANEFNLLHFQVGSEGRNEGRLGKIWRLLTGPFSFFYCSITKKPDIILLNTSLVPKAFWRDLINLFIAKMLGIPTVYQVHGGELPERFLGTSRVARWFVGACMTLPNAIVLLAEVERQSYRRIKGIKLISVIPNAIDLSAYSHIKPKDFKADILQLGYIGRLADDKGIRESLLALCLLKESGDLSCRYSIAGAGPAENDLRELASKLKLNNDVCFLPPVFDNEKIKFWENTDIFLFPTTHREGLPYTILESLASGTPVITSRVGGIPDIVTDDIHGKFVDPYDVEDIADAIKQLTTDREKLRQMSLRAIERAHENYTVSRLASQFSQIFNKVLQ